MQDLPGSEAHLPEHGLLQEHWSLVAFFEGCRKDRHGKVVRPLVRIRHFRTCEFKDQRSNSLLSLQLKEDAGYTIGHRAQVDGWNC